MVRRLILAIAINAPVLPDETAAPARPCFTISMAIPIEVVLARRIAWLGRSLDPRSEEHTSELQSLMRISYAVFCLKKKTKQTLQHPVKHTNIENRQLPHKN